MTPSSREELSRACERGFTTKEPHQVEVPAGPEESTGLSQLDSSR